MLVELKQSPAQSQSAVSHQPSASSARSVRQAIHASGDLELISLCDGFIRLDGGAMFGIVPKALWEKKAPADERNRITLAMRPLIVRGARTMIIDAGLGDKESAKFHDIYGVDRARSSSVTLAEAGIAPEDIDIVLATHLHFDHAGGFTVSRRRRHGSARRFPRAQYIVRRGEWEDATHTARAQPRQLSGRTTSCRSPRPASCSWSTTTRRSCRA